MMVYFEHTRKKANTMQWNVYVYIQCTLLYTVQSMMKDIIIVLYHIVNVNIILESNIPLIWLLNAYVFLCIYYVFLWSVLHIYLFNIFYFV